MRGALCSSLRRRIRRVQHWQTRRCIAQRQPCCWLLAGGHISKNAHGENLGRGGGDERLSRGRRGARRVGKQNLRVRNDRAGGAVTRAARLLLNNGVPAGGLFQAPKNLEAASSAPSSMPLFWCTSAVTRCCVAPTAPSTATSPVRSGAGINVARAGTFSPLGLSNHGAHQRTGATPARWRFARGASAWRMLRANFAPLAKAATGF